MIPLAVASLCIMDCAFCGFRDAAGRDPRIRKLPYYVPAVLRGFAIGIVVVAIFGGLTAWLARDGAVWADMLRAGEAMVDVYSVYATLVLAGLAVYLIGRGDVRALGTVSLLGPMTLIRPAVITGGIVWAIIRARRPETIALVSAAGWVMVLLEPGLDRLRKWRAA